jgi:hypothetical protein
LLAVTIRNFNNLGLHLSSPKFTCRSLPASAISVRFAPAAASVLEQLPWFKGEKMKSAFHKFAVALGILLMGTLLGGKSFAACGDIKYKLVPQSWNRQSGLFLPVSATADPIVGMWHVTLTAQGNEAGPHDGTPIDNGINIWHSDGTEILNSDRPAQDGNICIGIWEKAGKSKYRVNHIPWGGNDPSNAPSGMGNPLGASQITEEITLTPDGNHYSGTFTLDAYDPSGNQVVHIVGVLSATRVTINTKVKDLL